MSSTSCISWLNNATHFPPLQNVHIFYWVARTTLSHLWVGEQIPLAPTLENLWMPWWTSQTTLGENMEMAFFVVLCLGSFHSAKVGLVCSHVWLGHLLAHTNDPNWESGLHFRVTDRLTGMWGMWPGGTRLLSGPSYQLAAYCTGHLPCCSLKVRRKKLTLVF